MIFAETSDFVPDPWHIYAGMALPTISPKWRSHSKCDQGEPFPEGRSG